MDEQFILIQFLYNSKQKFQTFQKTIPFNSKLMESNKKVLFTKLIADKNKYIFYKNRLSIVFATDKKLYFQDLDEPRSFRTIFEINDQTNSNIYISQMFEGNNIINNLTNGKQKSYNMLLLICETVLIECDIYSSEMVLDSTISGFLLKGKAEGKSKCLKYDIFQNSENIFSYSILNLNEEMKNPKYIWKFSSNTSQVSLNDRILDLKFRPKILFQQNSGLGVKVYEQYMRNNQVSLSFQGGILRTFKYDSKALMSEWKTIYGNISSLEYSLDGRLLGVGTECDIVYILDAEFNQILYSLEGHKNYISSIIFEEQIFIEEETTPTNTKIEQKNSDNNIHYLSNYHSTSNPINQKGKEISLDDLSKVIMEMDEGCLDIKQLRRTRTSVNQQIEINNEDLRTCITYDIFTAGLDGYLGVWRIDFLIDLSIICEKNYSPFQYSKDSIQIIKMEHPGVNILKTNEVVYHTSLSQIKNAPLCKLLFIDNLIIYLSRRNQNGSAVAFVMYHGINKIEEIREDSKENSRDKGTSNLIGKS
jgi:hypothetical protein